METWVHGAATIIQHPERVKLLERTGDFGAIIEQDAVSGADNNWFHLPIPTPRSTNGDMAVGYFHLIAKLNDKAIVDKINLGSGTAMIQENPGLSFTNTTIDRLFKVNRGSNPSKFAPLSGVGVLIAVHVVFLPGAPRGRVEFYGGGVNFG